jgi:hypothetical protein
MPAGYEFDAGYPSHVAPTTLSKHRASDDSWACLLSRIGHAEQG